jgi:putative transposase
MCSLFRNKYRIESTRYRGYDYSSPGKYFITICTKNKISYFGEVVNGKMILAETGQIAEKFWLEIPGHFPNIDLDEFIIMPDHIHGIIIIKAPKSEFQSNSSVQAPNLGVSIDSANIILPGKLSETPKLGVSTIINQFKRICTITIKTRGFDFAWQPRYYDHIIRTRIELYRIRKYIRENPEKLSRK